MNTLPKRVPVLGMVLASLVPWASAQVEVSKLTPGGAAGDHFGRAVTIDGTGILIGAPKSGLSAADGGAAYVYEFAPTGWVQSAVLLPGEAGPGDQFGWSVALEGDTALVGSWLDDDDSYVDSGAVYVFERGTLGWAPAAKLTASDRGSFDRFGSAVALAGDTAVVGAMYHIGGGQFGGAVYVFERTPAGWVQTAKVTPSDGVAGDTFGASLALSGDTLVVGSPAADDALPMVSWCNSGAFYIYDRTPSGWVESAKFTAVDGWCNDRYSYSVAIEDDTVFVAARGFAAFGGNAAGKVYVYQRVGGGWSQVQELLASDGAPLAQFGTSVALDQDRALIGADADPALGSDAGSAYLFERQAGSWVELAKLTASDGGAAHRFGEAVDLDGGRLVAGAIPDQQPGAVYVFAAGNLTGSPAALSLSTGGVQQLEIEAGAACAALDYIVLGSKSGTSPGLPLDGLLLPLNVDGYTLATLMEPNRPPLGNTYGLLDAGGRATATITVPTGLPAGLAGLTLHHAGLLLDSGTLAAEKATEAIPLALTP